MSKPIYVTAKCEAEHPIIAKGFCAECHEKSLEDLYKKMSELYDTVKAKTDKSF